MSINSQKLKFSIKLFTFSLFDMCCKPIICSKIVQKGKIFSRLLEWPKVATNAKGCAKVAQHNRDKPTFWLIVWSADLLVGRLVGWWVGWLFGCLASW